MRGRRALAGSQNRTPSSGRSKSRAVVAWLSTPFGQPQLFFDGMPLLNFYIADDVRVEF
jgi:hypothetical protein